MYVMIKWLEPNLAESSVECNESIVCVLTSEKPEPFCGPMSQSSSFRESFVMGVE